MKLKDYLKKLDDHTIRLLCEEINEYLYVTNELKADSLFTKTIYSEQFEEFNTTFGYLLKETIPIVLNEAYRRFYLTASLLVKNDPIRFFKWQKTLKNLNKCVKITHREKNCSLIWMYANPSLFSQSSDFTQIVRCDEAEPTVKTEQSTLL